ncbi:putative membrane protein YesL [Gracilibacillus halotolerans]|uniref:Putative membrane protein YesL n=2 Tax=Gracilibacillus halotolerans TaxID=74386 RepID=A0A841RN24_9BACI|nr:putative membrane protein YesL [Gracilibacillus halotolerans]
MGNMIFKIADIIYRFVALNLIWLLFFIMGLGVLGFMPATVALFSVIRKWLMGEKDLRLFHLFFSYYKSEFIRSNILGCIYFIAFYIIYVNYAFVPYFYDEQFHIFLYIIIFSVAVIVFMSFMNLFSMMAHFEFKLLHYLKVSFGLVFFRPMNTLMQLVWFLAYYILSIQFPTIFIVIGISVFAFVLMAINYKTFITYKER